MLRMRNVLVPALLGIVLLAPLANAQEKSDREHDGLKGPVRKIVIESALIYQESGKYLETERYLVQTVIYSRDSKKIKEIEPEGTRHCPSLTKYIYDNTGRVIEEHTFSADGSVSFSTKWVYDADGNLIEGHHYDEKGALYRKWAFTYEADSYGNWIKQTSSMQDAEFFDGRSDYIPRDVTYRTITYY